MNVKSGIKRLLYKIVKISYSIWYKFIKTDEKMVLFLSYHGRGYLCNPKYIHKKMISEDKFSDYKFIWVVGKGYKGIIPNSKIIKYNSLRYLYYMAKSKYWIINCKLPEYIKKKENQIYLQTWHGTPLKRLAHDIVEVENRTFYRTEISGERMLHSYDVDVERYNYLISANEFSTEKFQTAFKIEKNRIIQTGYPRNDYLVNHSEKDVLTIKEKYNIPLDKKVILYAPTWRDDCYKIDGYYYEIETDFNKWKDSLGEDYVVLFKQHYIIKNSFVNKGLENFIYYIEEDVDINELYIISDILVTDYSSVFFDYAILERPILFYMYDLEKYKNNIRGFYLDIYKDLPGDVVENTEELLSKIIYLENNKNLYINKIRKFNTRFNDMNDGKATTRVLNTLFKK